MLYIFEYGYDTMIIRARDPEHALDIYNDQCREENDANRYTYPLQIDGGGKKQRRGWKQYNNVEMESVSIEELKDDPDEFGIIFKREENI